MHIGNIDRTESADSNIFNPILICGRAFVYSPDNVPFEKKIAVAWLISQKALTCGSVLLEFTKSLKGIGALGRTGKLLSLNIVANHVT
jgi:hypothetical protein